MRSDDGSEIVFRCSSRSSALAAPRSPPNSIFQTPEERDGMLESGMESGMNETYARLDELLAQQAG